MRSPCGSGPAAAAIRGCAAVTAVFGWLFARAGTATLRAHLGQLLAALSLQLAQSG